jgi:dolichol kinase
LRTHGNPMIVSCVSLYVVYSPMTPVNIFVICFVMTCDTSSIIGRRSIVIPGDDDDDDDDDDE